LRAPNVYIQPFYNGTAAEAPPFGHPASNPMLTRPAIGTLQRARRSENYGIAALWLGAIAYGASSALLVAAGTRHFELAVIALQVFILLPALVYGLRSTQAADHGAFRLRSSPAWRAYVVPFLAVALIAGYIVGRGVLIPDESGYRFQAKIFAHGELSAPAPIGATNTPDTPRPVNFVHQVVHDGRWFSKYPAGWPAVLAIPEKLHVGWAAAPLLGTLLLVITGLIAREAFGAASVAPSLWIAVLSPFWLATCLGRLSEALCAVLVAGACLFCLRAMRAHSLRNFALMYILLVPGFLVRPFTALVASVVFGISALLWSRRNRGPLFRVALVSALAGCAAVALTLFFNFVYTGSLWLSPYALYKGIAVPNEITASPARILANLLYPWRFSAQSILVYTFPFVFFLAIYGLWTQRRSWAAWVVAATFPALVVAYLADSAGPSSIIGERYWFEGFFGIAVLAGQALVTIVSTWRISKRLAAAAIASLTCAQLALTVATVSVLYSFSEPYSAVRAVAAHYRNCHCAVFIGDTPQDFYSRNMDMNGANWQHAGVFYFNDPGPEHRQLWANRYGWHKWAVVIYDAQTHSASARMYRETAQPNSP
jgi:hypothetical protein